MHDILNFLYADFLAKPIWMWILFLSIVLILVLDLGVFHRHTHEIDTKESLLMSVFYISIGLLFGGWIWWIMGAPKAVEYVTGFVIEKTLALDNIFVIAMIFSYFSIPRLYQHRVLFWGILGVILLRGIMIGFGAALLQQFHWILYLFAPLLIYTGIKMFLSAADEDEMDMGNNRILKFMRKNFRITEKLHDDKFIVHEPHPKTGKSVWFITPLLVTLVMVEIADVVFAIDSVPAIFAITTDPYIVYTSNIFAILGLRALYFALAAMIHRFHYLKYALAVVLVFIGSKIAITDMLGLAKFPPLLSLGITIGIIAGGVIVSLRKTKNEIAQS
jgi:tellurite resistance protein TerC